VINDFDYEEPKDAHLLKLALRAKSIEYPSLEPHNYPDCYYKMGLDHFVEKYVPKKL